MREIRRVGWTLAALGALLSVASAGARAQRPAPAGILAPPAAPAVALRLTRADDRRRDAHVHRGAIVGALLGGGAVVALAASLDEPGGTPFYREPGLYMGVFLGAVAGAVVGGLIGAAIP